MAGIIQHFECRLRPDSGWCLGSYKRDQTGAGTGIGAGDTVGVSVRGATGVVCFHVNGNVVAECPSGVLAPLPAPVAPCVGLDFPGTVVCANFGPLFERGNAAFVAPAALPLRASAGSSCTGRCDGRTYATQPRCKTIT